MATIAVDWNGVLDQYKGYTSRATDYPPRSGAREFLQALRDRHFTVVIFTANSVSACEKWLRNNGLMSLVSRVTDTKPEAEVYVDDRSFRFTGDYDAALKFIESNPKPYWDK